MISQSIWKSWLLAAICLCILAPSAKAFPPTPHHSFYGSVRDELGNPLNVDNAVVYLETSSGVTLTTKVVPGLGAAMNYRLAVPMDAGITQDAYRPTALRPTVPFKMKVRIGNTTYLPIEMKGDFAQMGQPGKSTRLDLTLGEDSDNDGLPDAWERAILAQMGAGASLSDVNPNDDFDHDGLTNLQEYLAGTYAFDPKDGFSLKILDENNGSPVLEFLAIRGRTYTVQSSTDLKTWKPAEFALSPRTPQSAIYSNYIATDVRDLRIEVVTTPDQGPVFFKLFVQ